jgi:RimJ/RimL family protein N-acetyltransferase
VVQKAHRIWRERGTWGFLKFAAGRLFFRSFCRVLYQWPASMASAPGAENEMSVTIYDSRSQIPESVLSFLGPSHQENLAEVKAQDLLYVTHVDGRLSHYGFVMFQSRELEVLRERKGTALIGYCWTHPDMRGRGIYPVSLRSVISELHRRGIDRILIETDIENKPSCRGIEKAGFQLLRTFQAVILANCFAVGKVTDDAGTGFKLWTF